MAHSKFYNVKKPPQKRIAIFLCGMIQLKAGFDNYGAPGQVRCKMNKSLRSMAVNAPRSADTTISFEWNRNIGTCKTCSPIEHSPDLRKKCRLSK